MGRAAACLVASGGRPNLSDAKCSRPNAFITPVRIFRDAGKLTTLGGGVVWSVDAGLFGRFLKPSVALGPV